jgi:hypothetical protein
MWSSADTIIRGSNNTHDALSKKKKGVKASFDHGGILVIMGDPDRERQWKTRDGELCKDA